jgi:glycosyltransferase involved in cell wall biosynthesis
VSEVSVVLCTLDRADYLRRALQSLAEQTLARDRFEVVVVDNGSTDDTPAVAQSFADVLALRFVREPTLGLCHARNTGWRHAAGAVVAYFDDDAVATPEWLRAVVDAFARHPDAGIVGGPIVPIWEAPPPRWLSEKPARALTIVDWPGGPKRIPDISAEWLAGANLAVPRAVLEEVGGFDPRLDRIGSALLSNGDILLQRQIVARGYAAFYEPAMAIRHAVPRSRLTKAWFRRRYYWQGISDVIMQDIQRTIDAPPDRRRAVDTMLQLLRSPQSLRALLLPTDDPARFADKCWAWIEVGRVAALLGAVRP